MQEEEEGGAKVILHSVVYNQVDGGAFAERVALQEEQVCGVLSPVLYTQSLRYL